MLPHLQLVAQKHPEPEVLSLNLNTPKGFYSMNLSKHFLTQEYFNSYSIPA